MLFAGTTQADSFDWGSECLYGKRLSMFPALLGATQSLLSAVLIFLFLLALRNHFRVR